MKALKQLIKKEFIQIRRTRSMIAITFGVPIIQLVILGFAISGDVINVPAAITDLDNSATSRSLVSKLENTRYLDVRYRLNDIRENESLLQHGDVILAVTIPRNFEKNVIRGEKPHISLKADAQNSNVALTGAGYIRQIVLTWAASLRPAAAGSPVTVNTVNLENCIRYNQELKNVYYMVPVILVLLVTVITMILTAMAIVREREAGTLEQLMVTPITRLELILGKTIPFLILGMFELVFALGVAKLIYRIQIAGSLPLFLSIALLFIFCILGFGILISTITQTQQQALFLAWFLITFFILMSGFFLPLDNMPKWVYYLTYINPLRYFMTVVRELFLKEAGIMELLPQVSAIALLAVSVNVVALIRFNKRLG